MEWLGWKLRAGFRTFACTQDKLGVRQFVTHSLCVRIQELDLDKPRNIWFQLLTLLIVSLARMVSKYGKMAYRRIKGEAPEESGGKPAESAAEE